jgi:hypothetical protein
MVFLSPIEIKEVTPKFHIPVRASYAALPAVTSKFHSDAAFPT